MLELGEIDGPIPVDVGLFQDLGKGRASGPAALARLPAAPLAQLLTLSMSCFISAALSRVSSPSPVRQFTSWLRSSLFKVPSSSKSKSRHGEPGMTQRPAAPAERPRGRPWAPPLAPCVLTEDAEGVVRLDVWRGRVTEHAEEVQEILKAQAVSGGGGREDPADALPEGVGLGREPRSRPQDAAWVALKPHEDRRGQIPEPAP